MHFRRSLKHILIINDLKQHIVKYVKKIIVITILFNFKIIMSKKNDCFMISSYFIGHKKLFTKKTDQIGVQTQKLTNESIVIRV